MNNTNVRIASAGKMPAGPTLRPCPATKLLYTAYKQKSYIWRILRGRAGVARWAHNPKVTSSNLVPATNEGPGEISPGLFVL